MVIIILEFNNWPTTDLTCRELRSLASWSVKNSLYKLTTPALNGDCPADNPGLVPQLMTVITKVAFLFLWQVF